MSPFVSLGVLVVGAVIVWGIATLVRYRDRRAFHNIDEQLEHLREVAWQHRDLAPDFATIMIDEINKTKNAHKRRKLEL